MQWDGKRGSLSRSAALNLASQAATEAGAAPHSPLDMPPTSAFRPQMSALRLSALEMSALVTRGSFIPTALQRTTRDNLRGNSAKILVRGSTIINFPDFGCNLSRAGHRSDRPNTVAQMPFHDAFAW